MGALVGAFGWEPALKLPPELLEEQTGRVSDTHTPPPEGDPNTWDMEMGRSCRSGYNGTGTLELVGCS